MSGSGKKPPTRRALLLWSAAAGIAAIALVLNWSSLRWHARTLWRGLPRAHQTPQQKLLLYFPYLKISEEVAESYVTDYGLRVHAVGRLTELDDDFFSRFLMSTDFFQNGGDESRDLQYVAIYGPSITPCYNPLAQLE